MAEGRPQKYGSQFHTVGQDVLPWPIDDEAHLDERRAQVGLAPFNDYRCVMQRMYGARQP